MTPVVVVAFGLVAGLLAAGVDMLLTVVAALVASAVIIGTIGRPAVGLAVLVFAIFTNASDVFIEHHGLPSLAKAYLPVVLLLIAYEWVRGRRHLLPPPLVLLLLGAYSMLLAVSLFYAMDTGRVAAALADFAKNAVFALAIAALASRADHFRAALWGIVAGTLWLSSLAALKMLTGSASDFGGFAQAAVPYVHAGGTSDRLSGPMQDPNFFAQFMLLGVAVAFERAGAERSGLARVIATIAVALGVVAIIATYSRGGLLALVCLLPVAVYRLRHRRRWIVGGMMVALMSLPALPAGYLDRAVSSVPAVGFGTPRERSPDESVRGRMGEMIVAWEIFQDHPVRGVGLGNYEAYFERYSLAFDQMPRGGPRPAHSLYLEIAAERGLIGLASFAALLGAVTAIGFAGWRELRRRGATDVAGMVAGLGVGFTGYLIAAVFLHDAYPRYFWLAIGLFLAVPGIVRNLPDRHDRPGGTA